MPASSGPIPMGAGDDVWHKHKAQIKDLYQNQRKTLREVKRLMEENGFPKTPLSTWESKLRETLQLRKKAKAHDWPLIYRHVLPRLEHPRKKQLKRKTVIRLSDSEIPWNKAWKEIRRSGALGMDSPSTSPSPLPPEVTIRSPSPGPLSLPPTPDAAQLVVSGVSTLSNGTTSSAVIPLQTSVAAPMLQTRSLMYSFSVYLLQGCASTIPWLEMCQSMQHMFRNEKHTQQLEVLFSSVLNEFMATSAIARAARSRTGNEIMTSDTRLDLLRSDRPIPPRPSPDLGYRVAKSGGQIQLGQFISTAIFLLSNRLHDPRDGDQGLKLLCSLLDRDASLTTTLLRSRVPSFRATWESLFEFSIHKNRRDTFRALTDIGIRNHWLNPRRSGNSLLCAIKMDCYDTVKRIVVYCCDSGCSTWWRQSFKAILAACKTGNVECASLLIQHCDVNVSLARGRNRWSMFFELIAMFESTEPGHALALDLFLVNGANVDKNTTSSGLIKPRWKELVGRGELFGGTRPAILDEVFYWNRSLFDKLRPYSRVPVSRITRTGLLIALEDGSQTARDYLSARQFGVPSFTPRHVQPLLELLLAEQFKIPEKVDLRIVQGLLEFGVDFNVPSIDLDVQDFWRIECLDIGSPERRIRKAKHLDFAWHQFTNAEERMGLLNMLLSKGGVIGERVLEGVVAQHGTGGLEFLAPHLPDFPTNAVRALVRAARSNDFQDVEFLLRQGVDPNAFILANGLSYSIMALATQAHCSDGPWVLPDGGCSLEMIQFLVRHGARLVVTPEDSTPFDFANCLIRESDLAGLFAKIKYALSSNTSSRLPSFLLESCLARGIFREEDESGEKRLEIFEYLFRKGAEVSPGSPLAALGLIGGREELVRDVLYAGSDMNAYWTNSDGLHLTPLQAVAGRGDETLVRLFLREGANVNSPPHGRMGVTALQAICRWHPATEEEHQRKMRICGLLINQGADVNGQSCGWMTTILGEAAREGDLELAALLLREGAKINATAGKETSLDLAASAGRLDMVKFLLSANALSCVRGATGYDGSINEAESRGHSAVAGLIREYAAKIEAGTVFNPELLKPQDECRVHGFGADVECSDDNYEPSSDDDAEDVGIDDGTSGLAEPESGYRGAAQTIQGEQAVAGSGEASNLESGFVLSEEDWPLGLERGYVQPSDFLDPTESWTGQVVIDTVAADI